MEMKSDPNILYGGDPHEGYIGFASVGEFVLAELKIGGDHTAFVSS